MNEVEEEQAREGKRQSARLRVEPTAGGRNQIIGQRIRQKSLGADVRDDLQPGDDLPTFWLESARCACIRLQALDRAGSREKPSTGPRSQGSPEIARRNRESRSDL